MKQALNQNIKEISKVQSLSFTQSSLDYFLSALLSPTNLISSVVNL